MGGNLGGWESGWVGGYVSSTCGSEVFVCRNVFCGLRECALWFAAPRSLHHHTDFAGVWR